MNFRDTAEEAVFRSQVQTQLKEAPRVAAGASREEAVLGNFEDNVRWWKKLAARGWLAPSWPTEYGGGGLSMMQQFVLNEELALHNAPRPLHLILSLGVVGATILVHGTDEQKNTYVRPIADGNDIWCQGYSEPEVGSDLASVKTPAVLDGDDFVINGEKMYTSLAQYAKFILLLARTNPEAPKHKGITCFIVDMKAPGVMVRPLTNMAGDNEFNQVFFDNVRVPRANVLGEVNDGWRVTTTSLDHERSSIATAIGMKQMVEALIDFAREHVVDHTSALGRNRQLRQELADRLVEAEVARMFSYRIASMQSKGLIPNQEASALKLFAVEVEQRITRTGVKTLGLYGQLLRGPWAPMNGRAPARLLRALAKSIEGGTSEIQRGIIATRGLGLPRSN